MAFRVLSIDGGGMRGIYSAAYLGELERGFCQQRGHVSGLDVGAGFQLIVGTSTGAIIGCALAKGKRLDEVVQLYQSHGASIFPKKMPEAIRAAVPQMLTRPRYLKSGDAALRKALEDQFGTTTLRDIWESRRIALAVPAVNMSNYRAWVFKTPHDPKSNHRDDNRTLAEICLASSAAPLFRSLAALPHSDGTCDVFADGGLWANNPVIVALVEALRMISGHDEEIEIYSLGSCGKPEGEVIQREAVHRGLGEWKFGGEAAKVSIAAQEYAFDMVATLLVPHLCKPVKLVRFPSEKIPGALLQYLDLDETRPEGLEAMVRQARQDAHATNSAIQRGTIEGKLIESLFNDMPPRVAEQGV